MYYNTLVLFTILSLYRFANSSKDRCPNIKTAINSIRKRRHLGFPNGTVALVNVSHGKTFLTHVPSGWYHNLELNALYPLTDSHIVAVHSRRKVNHRQKKDLWETLKSAIDLHNFNGRACILKSICEARTHLAPPGKSLVHDMLRAIFTYPELDEDFKMEVKDFYDELLDPNFCETVHECPISIIQFMLSFNKHKK